MVCAYCEKTETAGNDPACLECMNTMWAVMVEDNNFYTMSVSNYQRHGSDAPVDKTLMQVLDVDGVRVHLRLSLENFTMEGGQNRVVATLRVTRQKEPEFGTPKFKAGDFVYLNGELQRIASVNFNDGNPVYSFTHLKGVPEAQLMPAKRPRPLPGPPNPPICKWCGTTSCMATGPVCAESAAEHERRDGAPSLERHAAKMDAPGGPVCWCGKPSTHQDGWCGICPEKK